jgi:DNA-binding MarR family transcriptional regulator
MLRWSLPVVHGVEETMTEKRKKARAKIRFNIAMGRCMNHPMFTWAKPHGPVVDEFHRCARCAGVDARASQRRNARWHATPAGTCRHCGGPSTPGLKTCIKCRTAAYERRDRMFDPVAHYDGYRDTTRGRILRVLRRADWMSTTDLRETLGIPSARCHERDNHDQMLKRLLQRGLVEKRRGTTLCGVSEYRITETGRAELASKQEAARIALQLEAA